MEYRRARILASLGRRDEAAPLLERALKEPALLEPGARIEGDIPVALRIGVDQGR
jgi:hypothetical protein